MLLGRFLECIESRRLTLYPAQADAVLELYEYILNTPTGSGKSLVAGALYESASRVEPASTKSPHSICVARSVHLTIHLLKLTLEAAEFSWVRNRLF